MSGTKCYYLKGWLHPDSMLEPEWLPHWQASAKAVHTAGKQLVVFEMPNNPAGGSAIEEIELLLQSKFGIQK